MPTPRSILKKTPAKTTRKNPLKFNPSVTRRKTFSQFNGNSNNGVNISYFNRIEGLHPEEGLRAIGKAPRLPAGSPLRWTSIPINPINTQSENLPLPPGSINEKTGYKIAGNLHAELIESNATKAARAAAARAEEALASSLKVYPGKSLGLSKSTAHTQGVQARSSLRSPNLSSHLVSNPLSILKLRSIPPKLRSVPQYTPLTANHIDDLIEYLKNYKVNWNKMTSEKKRFLASTFGLHLSRSHNDLITSSLYKKGGRTRRKRRTN
jgi:hypothetical protein